MTCTVSAKEAFAGLHIAAGTVQKLSAKLFLKPPALTISDVIALNIGKLARGIFDMSDCIVSEFWLHSGQQR